MAARECIFIASSLGLHGVLVFALGAPSSLPNPSAPKNRPALHLLSTSLSVAPPEEPGLERVAGEQHERVFAREPERLQPPANEEESAPSVPTPPMERPGGKDGAQKVLARGTSDGKTKELQSEPLEMAEALEGRSLLESSSPSGAAEPSTAESAGEREPARACGKELGTPALDNKPQQAEEYAGARRGAPAAADSQATGAGVCWQRVGRELERRSRTELPLALRRVRLHGRVVIGFSLAGDGEATDVHVVSRQGSRLLESAARALLEQPFSSDCPGTYRWPVSFGS